MAKQVWLTTDGNTFTDQKTAEKYEQEYLVRTALMDCMDRDYRKCLDNIMNCDELAIVYVSPAVEAANE